MRKLFAGIDLGGTTAKLGLFTEEAKLLKKWEIPTRKEDGGSHVIPDLAETILAHVEELGYAKEDLAAAALGVPGPIRKDGYLEVCVNIGFHGVNPPKQLSKLLGGIPVAGGNDANIAALGEAWQGAAKGYSDCVMVTLGTGVGGGIINEGEIVVGSKGMGGEIGHMTIDWKHGKKCNCGNTGCLETMASATGIANTARDFLCEHPEKASSLRALASISAKDVFDAAKAGDETAQEIADYCMMILARALALISQVTDPEIIVIGGGVSRAGEYLTDLVRKHYEPMITLSHIKAKIELATLGNDAGIFGAARLAMIEFRKRA